MNKINKFLLSLFLSYFIVSVILFFCILQNIETSKIEIIPLNEKYYMVVNNFIFKTSTLIKKIELGRDVKICDEILDFSNQNEYYIGNFKDRKCGYFYISKYENEISEFGLSIDELKSNLKTETEFKHLKNRTHESFLEIEFLIKNFYMLISIVFLILLFLCRLIFSKFDYKINIFFKILILSFSFSYVCFFTIFLDYIKKEDYKKNIGIGLNESYYMEISSPRGNYVILKAIKDNNSICGKITKIYRYGYYHIGYLEGEEKCRYYFYLNSIVSEDSSFRLSENQIINKFGKIVYKEPKEYLDKYGENGDYKGKFIYDVSFFIIFFIIFCIIIFISVCIFLTLILILKNFNDRKNK